MSGKLGLYQDFYHYFASYTSILAVFLCEYDRFNLAVSSLLYGRAQGLLGQMLT